MTTYWLDKAHESNTNSNELAIAKLEVMVQEILQSNEQEERQRDYDNNGGGSDNEYDMEDMSVNSRAQVVDETNLFTSELGVIQEHQSSKSKMDVFNIEGGAGAGVENAIHGTGSDVPGQMKTPNSQSTYRQRAHSSPEKAHNRSSNSVVSPRTNGSYRVGAKGQSPTQHSNPHALHSIRYNIAHKLSEGQEFTSSGAKILVVEDSPAQRKMLVKRLHVADPTWDVSQAISGEDALRMLQAARWTFDVVFVDENLSSDDGLFGHELVQVMRRQPQMLTTVIIACTSNPAVATEKLLAAGVDYVWPKPPPLPSVIKPKIDSLLAYRIKTFGKDSIAGAEL
uniref:Response regulatory domain-containing protein n=1 Tax=Spumella elongata TaxID=89044 RepID=A0A7S3MEH8_9STRA|mmetsp:Transcript_59036/g.103792  ORF Transcript_59036/g.103792 Transcript_59036/m.103792 type:complete len:339 (+) Transcript_59036:200-1216(+)